MRKSVDYGVGNVVNEQAEKVHKVITACRLADTQDSQDMFHHE